MMRCICEDYSVVLNVLHIDWMRNVFLSFQQGDSLVPLILILKALTGFSDEKIFNRLLNGRTDTRMKE